MRKLFLILGLVVGIFASNFVVSKAEAATLSEVINGKRPYVFLIYTSWANGQEARQNMARLSKKYPAITFKSVHINSEEVQALFAKGPMTFAGFPYIQMARGKVGSFVEPSCAKDYACFEKKLSRFFK